MKTYINIILNSNSNSKVTDNSYVQSPFSTITTHINYGIWETLYSWICFGNESACVQVDHGSTYVQNIQSAKLFLS